MYTPHSVPAVGPAPEAVLAPVRTEAVLALTPELCRHPRRPLALSRRSASTSVRTGSEDCPREAERREPLRLTRLRIRPERTPSPLRHRLETVPTPPALRTAGLPKKNPRPRMRQPLGPVQAQGGAEQPREQALSRLPPEAVPVSSRAPLSVPLWPLAQPARFRDEAAARSTADARPLPKAEGRVLSPVAGKELPLLPRAQKRTEAPEEAGADGMASFPQPVPLLPRAQKRPQAAVRPSLAGARTVLTWAEKFPLLPALPAWRRPLQ
jgi:hypothetical protein